MAAASGGGPPQRVFTIERQREEEDRGRPLFLHYDEQAKKLTLTEEPGGADEDWQFRVDTEGYIQVVGQAEGGFLTRTPGDLGPVTINTKDPSPNSLQRWNFKAGPNRNAPPEIPDPAPDQPGRPEIENHAFTLVVTPDAAQADVMQVSGLGADLEVVARTGQPWNAPATQAFNFRRRGPG